MTTIRKDPDRLYGLLPALYRIADSERGGELRALLALVTEQADALHADTQQLWDDFFIETCQRWVIPYIGELVGNNPLHDLDLSAAARTAQALFTDLAGPDLEPPGAIRTRADVAKTIYYRRRKGTPPMLEELARDVTGWGAHVVEFFTLLDWNQHLEHLRLDCHGCPDLRRVDVGDRAGGPWDTTTHTVDVRRINEWDGWYNIPNIGFFLWRLGAYRLTRITPRAIGGTSWRLTFSPLGQDIPLFSAGQREAAESLLATELHVEAPIRAAAFHEDLVPVPPAPAPTGSSAYYGDPAKTDASLVVFTNDPVVLANDIPVPASEVECANLQGWTALAQPTGKTILIDATRGRLVVPQGRAGERIRVSYFHGFSAPMGGGEYDRAKWIVPSPPPALVSGGGATLDDAIAARTTLRTVIQVEDDATYDITTNITLAANESLTIQAKNGARPHLRFGNGSIAVLTSGTGASLSLGGLLIEGGLHVDGDLDTLRLLHTTLVPGRSVIQEVMAPPAGPSIVVAPGPAGKPINTRLEVQIAFSIVGALRIPSHVTKLLAARLDRGRDREERRSAGGGRLRCRQRERAAGAHRALDDLRLLAVSQAGAGQRIDFHATGARRSAAAGVRALLLRAARLTNAAAVPLPAGARDGPSDRRAEDRSGEEKDSSLPRLGSEARRRDRTVAGAGLRVRALRATRIRTAPPRLSRADSHRRRGRLGDGRLLRSQAAAT